MREGIIQQSHPKPKRKESLRTAELSPGFQMEVPESAGNVHDGVVETAPLVAEYVRNDAKTFDSGKNILHKDSLP